MNEFLGYFKIRWAEKYPEIELTLSDERICFFLDKSMTISMAIKRVYEDIKKGK